MPYFSHFLPRAGASRKSGLRKALGQAAAAFFPALLLGGLLISLPLLDAQLEAGLFQPGRALAAERDDDDEGRRPPPEARSSQTLGRRVYTRITEVIELRDAERYDEARAILNEVREMYDRDALNDREKFVMWQFYASLAQSQEDYQGAINAFNQILRLPNLTQDQIEQTRYSLGALNYVLENLREAINQFEEYNRIALEPNEDVYLRLGTAHYLLEEYRPSIPHILRAMEIMRSKGEEIPKNTYDLLRSLYFIVEDYPRAYQTLREMVVLYNDPDDWPYLPAVLGQMERLEEQSQSFYVNNALGYLEEESQLVNLAAQLYNRDYAYGCAKVMQMGMDRGIIEEDEGNLSFLSTCYQVAREDELAAPPLERAAGLSDDGEHYARLGRIYLIQSEFEKAIEAFDNALDRGGIDRPDQLRLSQARAYMELNRYDAGIQAARAAGRDRRSADAARNWVALLTREKDRYESLQRQRRELAEFLR